MSEIEGSGSEQERTGTVEPQPSVEEESRTGNASIQDATTHLRNWMKGQRGYLNSEDFHKSLEVVVSFAEGIHSVAARCAKAEAGLELVRAVILDEVAALNYSKRCGAPEEFMTPEEHDVVISKWKAAGDFLAAIINRSR